MEAASRCRRPLSDYAKELRTWLHMTRQCHMNNAMCQAAMMMPPMVSTQVPAPRRDAVTGGPQPPRAFPESAGR